MLHALQPETLDELADLARLLVVDADVQRHRLAGTAVRRLFDLAVVERLQRDLAAHQLLLEHLRDRLEAFLGRRFELDRIVLQVDHTLGALEVEARRQFPTRLIDGVADLLEVDL